MPFQHEAAPTSLPTLDGALARLAALAGRPAPALPPAGDELDRLFGGADAIHAALAPLHAELGGSLLTRLPAGLRFDGDPNPKTFPKDAKKALKKGEIIATSDAAAWIVERQPDGAARLSFAHPESFAVLGESLAAWLDAEGGRIEAARRGPAPAGSEGKAAIDALIARIAARAGADVSATLAALPTGNDRNRWDYACAAIAACGPIWSPEVLAATEGRLLGLVLRGARYDAEPDVPWTSDAVDDYPKAARPSMNDGWFIAARRTEIWYMVREPKGKSQIHWKIELHHADVDGYEPLGPVEAWLTREVERLEA
jgi:hypothetical protein